MSYTEMMDRFEANYTPHGHTCSEACWYAREDTCRCSCGGENHGILLVDGAEKPTRRKRVKTKVFELDGVVVGYSEAQDYARSLGGSYPQPPEWAKVGDCHAQAAARAKFGKWAELNGFTYSPRMEEEVFLIWRRVS